MQLGFANLEQDTDIQLGHGSPQWSRWDGGKIGGRPSWLNPRDIPQDILRCRGPCGSFAADKLGTPLCFITQLYCPADDVRDEAFHRSLYVFACPKCCSGSSALMQSVKNASTTGDTSVSTTNHSLTDCVQILRCQLPKKNEFYPTTGNTGEWSKHTSQYWARHENEDKLNLCAVCGQRSKGKCPKQNKWFCSPNHQKEHLRATKKLHGDKQTSSSDENKIIPVPLQYLSSVCYETELVVEEEPQIISHQSTTSKDIKQSTKNSLFQSGEIADADSNLEQGDLNAMTLSEAATGVTDPTTLAFYARMAIGGEENDVRDQCLRYSRWPETKHGSDEQEDDADNVGPLWLTSDNQPARQSEANKSSFPPPCQYCGTPRSFEFQVLPQMLHYLFHDPGLLNNGEEKSRPVLSEAESAILLEAASKIESGVELPPGFLEQHEKALAKARDYLLGIGESEKKTGIDDIKDCLEWGTIAIYTCTASCGDGDIVSPRELKNLSADEKDRLRCLGAYREEVAWVQPPLD
jgi:pre-rRNA-processing protein TSR4